MNGQQKDNSGHSLISNRRQCNKIKINPTTIIITILSAFLVPQFVVSLALWTTPALSFEFYANVAKRNTHEIEIEIHENGQGTSNSVSLINIPIISRLPLWLIRGYLISHIHSNTLLRFLLLWPNLILASCNNRNPHGHGEWDSGRTFTVTICCCSKCPFEMALSDQLNNLPHFISFHFIPSRQFHVHHHCKQYGQSRATLFSPLPFFYHTVDVADYPNIISLSPCDFPQEETVSSIDHRPTKLLTNWEKKQDSLVFAITSSPSASYQHFFCTTEQLNFLSVVSYYFPDIG